MYPDALYSIIGGRPILWIVVAGLYALFDYAFNLFMCMITGGIQNLQNKSKKNLTLSRYKRFLSGGIRRVQEFRSDYLSWLWPITVLAIPLGLYGITRYLVEMNIKSLSSIGIEILSYWVFPTSIYVQVWIFFIITIVSLTTIYRYSRQRSKHTFFSKSTFYSTARVVLFNIPIGYAITNVALIIIGYSISLYRMLGDDLVVYDLFLADQMYGLRGAYDLILSFALISLLTSFLPTIILLREKKEKYSILYRLGIYLGIVVTFILIGILMHQFGRRLGNIQETALQSTDFLSRLESGDDIQVLTALSYYNVVANLPNNFPLPVWLSSFISIRTVILGYEILKLLALESKELSVADLLKSVMARL